MKPFVSKMPIHMAPQHTDIEEEAANDIVFNSEQRPQRYGERADSFANDQYEEVPQGDKPEGHPEVPQGGKPMDEKCRMDSNIDAIACAIMQAIDAVDRDEGSKITSIMVEIGLE